MAGIAETLYRLVQEFEQTTLGERKVSRLVIDMQKGKTEIEFCDSNSSNEDGNTELSCLEQLEVAEAQQIKSWKEDFDRWEFKHFGPIDEQDYRERVVKEVKELLNSRFLIPEKEILNSRKLESAAMLLVNFNLDAVYTERFALLCDLVSYEDGFFCFEKTNAIEKYIEANSHQLSPADLNALLRFKTMTELCWQRTHKKEDFASLPDSRKDILCEILQLVENGEWIAPATAQNIQDMFKIMLGTIGGKLTSDDAELSDKLWNLLELGKGDRVKVTFQNLIGYFISQRLLKEGSPAQNKKFFGDTEGYSNIDKGINRSEMSKGFLEILPLLDKFCPKHI